MAHLTTFVLQSQHVPTEKEVEAVLDSMLATAESQGFEPLRAQAIHEKRVSDTLTTKAHETLVASRVVNGGVVQAKWEGR